MNFVVTAYPLLPGLCNEDIDDALQYVGLTALTDRKLVFQPHEASATYVGYGFGLCKDYTDFDLCKIEEKELPHEHTLTVLYTQTFMIVVLYAMTTAYMYYEPKDTYLIDHEAGLRSLANYSDNPGAY